MKYSKVATLISLFIILFASCGEQKDNHDITIADYEVNIDDLDNKGIASISTYFSSVVPIVLETTDESLIKKINSIQVTNNLIFILDRDYKKLFCFNKNGQFIRIIGRRGNGPGEYSNISDFSIDTQNEVIFLLDNFTSKIHKYKLTGEHISSIDIDNSNKVMFAHIQYHNNKLYIDYEPNNNDIGSPLIVEIDINSGKKTNEFISDKDYNLEFKSIIYKDNSYFYSKCQNSPLYAPYYSNTLFSVKDNFRPYFKIKSNRLLQKSDIKDFNLSDPSVIVQINALDRVKSINNFLDSEKYMLCEYIDGNSLNTLIYNKVNGSYELYQGLFDDLTYNVIDESIPHYLGCADDKGIYTYIRGHNIYKLNDLYQSDKLKIDLSKFMIESSQKIQEDSNPIIFYYEFNK